MVTKERQRFLAEKYQAQFGQMPTLWARAPGRVDLMGSHTDYNLGFVMTMAIDRDTWIAARPRDDDHVSIYSLDIPGSAYFSLDDIQRDETVPWTNYVRGVAAKMRAAGHKLRGFDGLVQSTVPFASGLSSSAAIEMATAVLLKTLNHLALDPVEMALIGQKAENEFVGVNTGILDQYSSAMGEAGCAILLDCRHLTSEIVRIHPSLQVVICNTRAERNLVGSEYDDRRAQCAEGVRLLQQFYPDTIALRDVSPAMFARHEQALPVLIGKRCRFIIEENERVLALAQVLPTGQPEPLHALFSASYAGARDLYEIGAPSMAAMMRAMSSAPGVVAARQAGAGFGGCMVALVKDGSLDAFTNHVNAAYVQETNIDPDVYAVEAATGASMFEPDESLD